MAETFVSYTGLQHYDSKIKHVAVGTATITGRTITLKAIDGSDIGTVDIPQTVYNLASSTEQGLMSAAQYIKLEGITEGATKVAESGDNGNIVINDQEVAVYIHPTSTALPAGLYKITVDDTGHVKTGAAVTKADITALGIPAQDTTYTPATQSADGLMSAADKTKLDGLSDGATKVEASATNGKIKVDGTEVNVYTHETFTEKESGLYKVAINAEGHVSAATPVAKSDITALGIPAQDTTYVKATADADGLMSKEHFTKVEGVAAGAQVNVLEKVSVNGSPLTINSKGVNIDLTNYVQKEDVASALNWKGSVDTFDNLPTGAEVGDMYNVKAEWTDADGKHTAGTNVAWNGTAWDAMATAVTITPVSNDEIDAMFA